jgi:peptide/nickel transport system ATP-binding protein
MYLGKTCEVAPAATLNQQPAHPYTALLLAAIPDPDPKAVIPPDEISGELPSPIDPPSGCRFRTRCPLADERCAAEEPVLRAVAEGHFVACHHPLLDPLEGGAVPVPSTRTPD